jgi:hypothetical protein
MLVERFAAEAAPTDTLRTLRLYGEINLYRVIPVVHSSFVLGLVMPIALSASSEYSNESE